MALAEDMYTLRQEVSIARVDAHTQEDAHRGETVHVRVLLQRVQREEQPVAAPAHSARQDHQFNRDRIKRRWVWGRCPGEFRKGFAVIVDVAFFKVCTKNYTFLHGVNVTFFELSQLFLCYDIYLSKSTKQY